MKRIIFSCLVIGFSLNVNAQTKTTKVAPAKPKATQQEVKKDIPSNSDEPKVAKQEAKESGQAMDAEAMNAQWMEYMTPGEMHAYLSKSNGDWQAEITIWMDPTSEPITNNGKVNVHMILGERYQQMTHSGEFNGMPFEGIGVMGYDNAAKKFQSTWIDNMGTGIMIMSGAFDPKTKNLVLTGEQMDPMTGKMMKIREVIMDKSDGEQVMEMYTTPLNSKEFKSMEVKMKR